MGKIINWLMNNGWTSVYKEDDNGNWETHMRFLGSEHHHYHKEIILPKRDELEWKNQN